MAGCGAAREIWTAERFWVVVSERGTLVPMVMLKNDLLRAGNWSAMIIRNSRVPITCSFQSLSWDLLRSCKGLLAAVGTVRSRTRNEITRTGNS